jgi:hypothetical protein
MDEAGITASPKLRVIFFVVAALMLLLWSWSLIPPIESWDNPYEDGFSFVLLSTPASSACLPACSCSARRACPLCAVRRWRQAVYRGGIFDLPAYR